MVDANNAWDTTTALAAGRAFDRLGIHGFEEPVATDDRAGSARLAAALDTPVAGYETEYEGIEPEALFGDQLTVEFRFQENKDYIRKVLAQQIDLRQFGDQWLPKQDLPADWPSHRYKEEIVDLQASRQDPPERPGDELLATAREVALQIRQ
jgi:hypothetical protein